MNQLPPHTKPFGFTMLEILLSMALVSILFSFSVPLYMALYRRNDASVSSNIISQSLRRAQNLSMSGQNDSSWGIKISSPTMTLFQGTSYVARNTAMDEIYDISPSATYSGLNEIVYSKLEGIPNNTGTITLTLPTGEVENISINEKGTISY